MAAKTLYTLFGAVDGTYNWTGLQDGGSAPSVLGSPNWNVGNQGSSTTRYARYASQGQIDFSSYPPSTNSPEPDVETSISNSWGGGGIADSYRTQFPISGTFAAGNWSITFKMAVTAGTTKNIIANFRLRIWRSANADGTGATEITTATLASTGWGMADASVKDFVFTWAAPSFTLSNEYLFYQVGMQVTGNSGSANQVLTIYSAGATTTTNFTPYVPPLTVLPSYRSSSSNASSSGNASAIGNLPAGTVNGDVLYAGVWTSGNTTNPTITAVPTGWTLLDSTTAGNSRMSVYWKIAASEPSTWTWTLSGAGAWVVQVVAVQNPADAVTPTDITSIASSASSVNVLANTVTTTQPNGVMIGFFGLRAASVTFTPDGAMTEVQDQAGSPQGCLETAIQTIAASGATGSRTAVATSAGVNVGWLGVVKGGVLASKRVEPFIWSL